jgi:hypothetical protein
MIKLFFTITFGLICLSAQAKDKPGLYKVSSVYFDTETQKEIKYTGTGIYIAYQERQSNKPGNLRYFILTAAHVSQGQQLTIIMDGKPAKIKENGRARLANNRYDLEWIEIDNPGITPFAYVEHPCQGFAIEVEINPFGRDAKYCISASANMVHEWNDSMFGSNYLRPGKYVIKASMTNSLFLLVPPWTNNGKGLDQKVSSYDRDAVSSALAHGYRNEFLTESSFGGEYSGTVKIRPGMSGAPLLIPQSFAEGTFNYRILGVAKQYDRRFYSSQVSSERVTVSAFESFLNGKRGLEDQTKLQIRNGLLYKDYGSGILSIYPNRGNSGNADKGDGGNADKGDGGDDQSSSESVAPYDRFGILPGLSIQNKNVIAFMTTWGEPIYANESALDFILSNPSQNAPIFLGDNLVKYLIDKFPKWSREALKKFTQFKAIPYLPNNPSAELRFDNKSAKISLQFKNNDRITLSFDAKGTCLECKHSSFMPVFSVLSDLKKERYWIDLRRLFLTDISFVPFGKLDANRDLNARPPILVIRKDQSLQEVEIPFNDLTVEN